MEIKVFSTVDDNELTVSIESITNGHPTTVKDVLSLQAVVDAFEEDPEANFESYNGDDVPEADAIRNMVLAQQAKEGDEYGINACCEIETDDDDDEPQAPAAQAPVNTGADGFCTVISNGGFVTTRIAIKNGVTKLADVVFSDEVSRNSGMSRSQLSNCDITQNYEQRRADSLEHAPVKDGDTIRITLRVSKEGGRR